MKLNIFSTFNFQFSIAIVLAVAGCTRVNDYLGGGLVPKNQQMEIKIGMLGDDGRELVKTQLYEQGAVPSSRTGYAYLGQKTDAVFGALKGSAVLQFLPASKPSEDYDGYGFAPEVDSVHMFFTFRDARGDVSKEQIFDVYALKDTIPTRDSVYRTDFWKDEYRGDKLFSFTHSGRGDVDTQVVTWEAEGLAFFKNIVDLDWDEFKDDGKFHKSFPGLYITPAGTSPSDAAVYRFDLAASGITLYAHNHVSEEYPTQNLDTLTTIFSFRDTDATNSKTGVVTKWRNVSINLPEIDYTGMAWESAINDTLDADPGLTEVYVQAMGGVGTYLRFTEEFVEELQNLRKDGEGKLCDIGINQAYMCIAVADDSTEAMDAALPRLGAWFDVKKLEAIPDYRFDAEALYRRSDPAYRLPYNGYLNRSTGVYEFEITAYIQALAGGKDIDHAIKFGGEAIDMLNMGCTTLVNDVTTTNPVSVRMTYTLISKK